jgi:hypothetical protein
MHRTVPLLSAARPDAHGVQVVAPPTSLKRPGGHAEHMVVAGSAE